MVWMQSRYHRSTVVLNIRYLKLILVSLWVLLFASALEASSLRPVLGPLTKALRPMAERIAVGPVCSIRKSSSMVPEFGGDVVVQDCRTTFTFDGTEFRLKLSLASHPLEPGTHQSLRSIVHDVIRQIQKALGEDRGLLHFYPGHLSTGDCEIESLALQPVDQQLYDPQVTYKFSKNHSDGDPAPF